MLSTKRDQHVLMHTFLWKYKTHRGAQIPLRKNSLSFIIAATVVSTDKYFSTEHMSTVKENKDNILADRTEEHIRTEEEKANTMSTQE